VERESRKKVKKKSSKIANTGKTLRDYLCEGLLLKKKTTTTVAKVKMQTSTEVVEHGGGNGGGGNTTNREMMSGSLSFNSLMSKEDEEMSRSALSNFRAKEEEIEKKKMEIRERVQLQLGRVEEETKRLATIREELESLSDPMRKEVSVVRKRIDTVNKELKPLGHTVQKKEKEYKEALEAFNEKNKEKVQLITKLMELVGESEKMRMTKLDELSKNVETIQ
jgi:chromosome segregation ATPase